MNIFSKIGNTISLVRDYWDNGGIRNFVPFDKFQSELTPQWLPNTYASLLDMFNTIPEVNAIISYLGSVISKIPYVLEKPSGKIVKSHELLDLMQNPNGNDSYERWQQNNVSSFFVIGNMYLNFSKPLGFENIKRIYQLPSYLTKVFTNLSDKEGNLPLGVDQRGVFVTNYATEENNIRNIYDAKDVLHIKDSNLNFSKGQFLYGQSRLYSAIMSITSLKSIYEAKVNAYQRGGVQYFISPSNPMASLSPDEKEGFESRLTDKYGLTGKKSPYYYANSPLNVTASGINIAQLQLTQMSKHDFGILCAVLSGFPSRLLNDDRATTYNNLIEDKKNMYTNIAMPYLDMFWESINNYPSIRNINLRFRADYDNIEELSKDRKAQSEIDSLNLKIILDVKDSINKGITTVEEGRIILENLDIGEEFEIDKIITDEGENNTSENEGTQEENGEETEQNN